MSEFAGSVLAADVAHRWQETGAPHPSLRGHPWVRSRCGLTRRKDDVMRFSGVGSYCLRCFPEAAGDASDMDVHGKWDGAK